MEGRGGGGRGGDLVRHCSGWPDPMVLVAKLREMPQGHHVGVCFLHLSMCDMLMLMLIHDKDQLAPMSSEAEFGFSLPIVHGRPSAPSMDDEKFVTPFGMHEDVVYLAEMEIGEQQQKQYLMIDTGSSLVWTQCDECPRYHVGNVRPYGRSQSRTFQEDQLAPMSSEAEFGFSLPIVHGRPSAPSMDDEKFVTPFGMHEDVVYLAEMEIGEQQQKQYLMIDTGSSLVWTQCDECPRYHVGNVRPYGRSQSRTFQEVSCGDNDKEEEAIASYYPAKPPRYIILCINGRCMFKVLYNLSRQGDTVQGYMLMNTFRFIDDRRYDYQAKFRMVFGCAHQERIVVTTVQDCTGIFGLGMGDASFLCQTGITRFSYCAPPRMPSISRRDSWLRFGSHAQISGKKVPLVMRWGKYYLPLTAITYKYNILMSHVPFIAYKSREDYLHMMVDRGTSLLNLPSSLYDDLLKEIDAIIKSENVVKAGTSSWPRHCYLGTVDKVKDITVRLSFDGGLDIELFTSALFVESQTKDGKPVVCVAMNRVDDSSEAILGMFAQTTINVGYDLLRGEIAMDPIRCAR
uniref:Peptidase A1 domain-containing protein n=1 Tax=Oryza punctata TaxID=4537 RepID=A0A0E0LSD4_ORYPU